VANSVRHATGVAHDHIELCVSASGARVRVEVANSGPGFTPPPRSAEPDTSGLGLHLIETLSDRWGTKRDERMRVWFELVGSGT
jgi:anti-sigma regulatory factor (Ser/Thr protein kinase)